VRQPVADLNTFGGGQCIELLHWSHAVNSEIAEVFNDARLVEDGITDRLIGRESGR
jgi:hypothetical protein